MKKTGESNQRVGGLAEILFSLRNRHFFVLDFLSFCITPVLALWLRTDSLSSLSRYADALVLYALMAAILRLSVFRWLGLYARYWRYASIDELVQIMTAVAAATFLIILAFFGVVRPLGLLFDDLPRSIPFIDGVLCLLFVSGSRLSVRLADRLYKRGQNYPGKSTRVLILGAGDAGIMIAKEMQANPQLGLTPVAFLDSDPRKHGATIQGVPVVGDRKRLHQVVEDYRVRQAIIAMPTVPGKTIRELTLLCQELNLPVKTVPGIFELLDGSVTVNQLRPVDITDLLRRAPVVTDVSQVVRLLKDKRVLVTGAGGSIGRELCRQIARCDPEALFLLGHGENSLFEMANELRFIRHAHLEIRTVVADVRDTDRLKVVFARYRPQVVFHTAAHKHVPMMEENVEEAVTNNVVGTRAVLHVATTCGVEQFVLISTDKAVNPTSIMGATKRLAELLVHQAAAESGHCFVSVRFGNVLDSRGSVLPLFKEQIARGGPVTITHPEMRRYFMTIPEAVQLVLQAATLGKGGETFCLDMGEPVRIVDLAQDLIRLSGLEVGRDIEIAFTGLRPGEKLFEELFLSGEEYARTSCEKIFVSRNSVKRPLCDLPFSDLDAAVNALHSAAQLGDVAEVRRLLQLIIPEYQPLESSSAPVLQAGVSG